MKIKDIAKQYHFDESKLESFLMYRQNEVKVKNGFTLSVDDGDVSRAVELYKNYLEEEASKKKQQRKHKRRRSSVSGIDSRRFPRC